MPEAKGFGLEGPLDKCFAGWSRADLAQLAVTILKTIGSLHRFNVLVGDVNLSNIRGRLARRSVSHRLRQRSGRQPSLPRWT